MLSFSVKTFKLILVYFFSVKKEKEHFLFFFFFCHKLEIIADSCQWIFLLESRGCGKVGTLVHILWQ